MLPLLISLFLTSYVYAAASEESPSFLIKGQDWGHIPLNSHSLQPKCKFDCTLPHDITDSLKQLQEHLALKPENLTLQIEWWNNADNRTMGLKNTQNLLSQAGPFLKKLNLTLSYPHIFTALFQGLNLTQEMPPVGYLGYWLGWGASVEPEKKLNALNLSKLEDFSLTLMGQTQEHQSLNKMLALELPSLVIQNNLKSITINLSSDDFSIIGQVEFIHEFLKRWKNYDKCKVDLVFDRGMTYKKRPHYLDVTYNIKEEVVTYAQEVIDYLKIDGKIDAQALLDICTECLYQQEILSYEKSGLLLRAFLGMKNSYINVKPRGKIATVHDPRYTINQIMPQAAIIEYDQGIPTEIAPDVLIVFLEDFEKSMPCKFNVIHLLNTQFSEIHEQLATRPADHLLAHQLYTTSLQIHAENEKLLQEKEVFKQEQLALIEQHKDRDLIFIIKGNLFTTELQNVLFVGKESAHKSIDEMHHQYFIASPEYYSEAVVCGCLMLYLSLNPELSVKNAMMQFKESNTKKTDDGIKSLDLTLF